MTFQRVSTLTLVYFVGRTLCQLLRQLSNFIPLLVVFFAGGEQLRGIILLWAPILIPTAIVLHAGLSWWYFRYALEGHTLHIRDGIFKRKQLTLDFARIQQADVREPWYFRPFKLAVLGVESAGSDSKEVELAGLSVDKAHALKARMLNASEVASEQESASPDSGPVQPSAWRMQLPLSEIARHGLMYNPILLLLPILAYPLSQGDIFDAWLLPRLEGFIDSFDMVQREHDAALLLSVLIVAALSLIVLLSVAVAIVRHFGFTITVDGERYHAKAGLLSVTSRSFQYVRLQRVIWQQGLIARLLQRYSMRVNQSGQHQGQPQDKAFAVPVLNAPRKQALEVQLGLPQPHWRRTHPASMILPWLVSVTLVSVLAGLISNFNWQVVLHTIWISALVAAGIQYLSWRKRAIFLSSGADAWLATRQGTLGELQRFVPSKKIQALKLRQGPWLRLFGSATLYVYSAAGRESISWLPYQDLVEIQQQLLTSSKTFSGRWM